MKKKYTYLIVIFLIVSTLAAFSRIAGNDFINYDDPTYITENNHIRSGINAESVKWAFSAFVSKNWHPLTWFSIMLDWSLFGANPSGHHLVSLLLHIGAVVFLFLFLNKATGNLWPAAFAAAIFALHPLRVESVAWAAERKDVLSMFFGMACLYAYGCYAQSLKLSKYFLCLILFALSLLAKSMLVTLPFIFLLLDYWPLGRWQKDTTALPQNRLPMIVKLAGEKIPFIFLSVVSCIMTILAQYEADSISIPFPSRVATAVISYASYLGKTFRPFDLVVYYPFEHYYLFREILFICVIFSAITIVVIYSVKKMPFLFVGWFWYLGTLIPVSGLVQINAPMADRYTYLPSIGIAVMLAWGIELLFCRADIRKKILFPAGMAVIIVCMFLTWRQCGYWKNSTTLWTHTIQVTQDNFLAYNNRGTSYDDPGKYRQAIEDFNEAIRLNPRYADALFNRGNVYASIGQYEQAVADYNEVIRLNPDYTDAYLNRGGAYSDLGRYQLALEDLNKVISMKKHFAAVFYKRGVAYTKNGRYQHAIKEYNKDMTMKQDFAGLFFNIGVIYTKMGQYQPAIENYHQAITLNPAHVDSCKNMGLIYLKQGNSKYGCHYAQKACGLGKCELLEAAKSNGFCH
jgi:protein O-mannosyl-transferase